MRRQIIILGFILCLGLPLVAQAQVRSHTYRPHTTRTITQTPVRYGHSPNWGVRGYVGGNGWVVGGYYGRGYSVGAHGYYRGYGYWGRAPRTILPVYRPIPGYIYYPPRTTVVVTPPIEQVVPVNAPQRLESKTISIPEGAAIYTKDGMVIENRDGKLLIYQVGEGDGQQ